MELEGVVDRRVGEQVCSQGLRLDLLLDHLLDLLAVLWMAGVNVVPNLQVLQGRAGVQPVSPLQRLGRADHSLLGILWRALEHCLVVGLQLSPEDTGDASLVAGINGLHRQLGHLKQHCADVMGALQHIVIDVHVVGQLSQTLSALLLRSAVHVLAVGETLCKQLPGLVVHAHLAEAGVRVLDLPQAEGAQTEHGNNTVVQDLRVHI
mmetsp:Transcript_51583/g.116093  ORF Transcript_51583/g.116093 Transcript_51583/m.116093 type:complete len:207 (-) Transcript_51583:1951-2571(-)